MEGFIEAYVDVFDLLFNGGHKCILRWYKCCPKSPFIVVTKKYDQGRGSYIYRYYYKNVYLGGEADNITFAGLNDAINALRGKGVFQYMDAREACYKPLSKTDEKIVKKLGLWAFNEGRIQNDYRLH